MIFLSFFWENCWFIISNILWYFLWFPCLSGDIWNLPLWREHRDSEINWDIFQGVWSLGLLYPQCSLFFPRVYKNLAFLFQVCCWSSVSAFKLSPWQSREWDCLCLQESPGVLVLPSATSDLPLLGVSFIHSLSFSTFFFKFFPLRAYKITQYYKSSFFVHG